MRYIITYEKHGGGVVPWLACGGGNKSNTEEQQLQM
jgi:hypothetical protein